MKKKLSLTILVIIIFIVTIFYPKNYSFLFPEKKENIVVISGLNNERKEIFFRQKKDIINIINIFSNYRYIRYFNYKSPTKRIVLFSSTKDKFGGSISIFDNNIIHYKNKDYIVISKNKTQKTLYEQLEDYINKNEYKEVGKSHSKLLEEINSKDSNNGNKKVAIVNKQVIYTYELEAAVLSHELAGNSYSEEEILDNIIRNIVLVQKAEEKGYSVSNERILREINAIREGYENDSDYRELIIPYLEGLEMTFEEYLEYSKKALKESIILNEMKKEQTKGMEKEEALKYWNDFVEQCISESSIKLFNTK